MKKAALILAVTLLAVSVDALGKTETQTGFLIPSQCKPQEGKVPQPKGSSDAWPAPHTTDCALRPDCIASGYGLWVHDRFLMFDKEGQKKALKYFRTTQRSSYHKVEVRGDFSKELVQVQSIQSVD